MPVSTQSSEISVWLAAIGATTVAADSGPASVGLLGLGMAPLAAPDRPADLVQLLPTVRVSDRGWIG